MSIAWMRGRWGDLSGQPISTPILRIRSDCSARASTKHEAAAPPMSVMKSRRLIELPFSPRTTAYHILYAG